MCRRISHQNAALGKDHTEGESLYHCLPADRRGSSQLRSWVEPIVVERRVERMGHDDSGRRLMRLLFGVPSPFVRRTKNKQGRKSVNKPFANAFGRLIVFALQGWPAAHGPRKRPTREVQVSNANTHAHCSNL